MSGKQNLLSLFVYFIILCNHILVQFWLPCFIKQVQYQDSCFPLSSFSQFELTEQVCYCYQSFLFRYSCKYGLNRGWYNQKSGSKSFIMGKNFGPICGLFFIVMGFSSKAKYFSFLRVRNCYTLLHTMALVGTFSHWFLSIAIKSYNSFVNEIQSLKICSSSRSLFLNKTKQNPVILQQRLSTIKVIRVIFTVTVAL